MEDNRDMKRTVDIAKILNHYGRQAQLNKTMEELAELQVAIAHEDNKDNVLEELADVQVMAEQVRLMWGIGEDELDRMIDYKVDRTIRRIRKEGSGK